MGAQLSSQVFRMVVPKWQQDSYSWPTCHEDPHILVLVLEGQDDLRDAVDDLFLEAACLPAAEEALLSRQEAVTTSVLVQPNSRSWLHQLREYADIS